MKHSACTACLHCCWPSKCGIIARASNRACTQVGRQHERDARDARLGDAPVPHEVRGGEGGCSSARADASVRPGRQLTIPVRVRALHSVVVCRWLHWSVDDFLQVRIHRRCPLATCKGCLQPAVPRQHDTAGRNLYRPLPRTPCLLGAQPSNSRADRARSAAAAAAGRLRREHAARSVLASMRRRRPLAAALPQRTADHCCPWRRRLAPPQAPQSRRRRSRAATRCLPSHCRCCAACRPAWRPSVASQAPSSSCWTGGRTACRWVGGWQLIARMCQHSSNAIVLCTLFPSQTEHARRPAANHA